MGYIHFNHNAISNSSLVFRNYQNVRGVVGVGGAYTAIDVISQGRFDLRSFSITAVAMGRDGTDTGTDGSSGGQRGNEPNSPPASNVIQRGQWSAQSFDDHASLRSSFYADKKNLVSLHACSRMDPLDVCLSRSGVEDSNHIFAHKVEEAKPITNQKSSGRCWIFAFLNCIRVPFMKHHNLESFEFSQSHLFFYDKLERCNYFLNTIVETAKRGEPIDGQLMSFLKGSPISDGGQWDMAVNLVRKYGLLPKQNFPESFSSESSMRLNAILKSKLREFSKEIRDTVSKGESDCDTRLQALLKWQMSEIFRVVSICLGIPKDSFTWEFYDKSKTYHKIGPLTPQQFYEEHVKPVFNLEDKVCLVHDPRPNHTYSRAYSVEFLGNVVGGKATIYNNQPIDLLLQLTGQSIKAGEPVWFGCEVGKRFAAKQGLEDIRIHDYQSVFGLEVGIGLNKGDRLIYGDSAMTHAMLFTAVSFEDDTDTVSKLRVENSWGEDRGEKGFLLMTAEWFREFVFEVVVDRSLVSEEVLNVFKQEPVLLPAWDPLGALACHSCQGQGGHEQQ